MPAEGGSSRCSPCSAALSTDSVSLFQAGTSRSELSDSGFVRVRKTSTGSTVGHAAAMAHDRIAVKARASERSELHTWYSGPAKLVREY